MDGNECGINAADVWLNANQFNNQLLIALGDFVFGQRWMRERNETFHNFATQKERLLFTNQFCIDFDHFSVI